MSIGENVRQIRMKAGVAQYVLANKIGITPSMLAQIERGTKVLSLLLANSIAIELGCNIYDFLDEGRYCDGHEKRLVGRQL